MEILRNTNKYINTKNKKITKQNIKEKQINSQINTHRKYIKIHKNTEN